MRHSTMVNIRTVSDIEETNKKEQAIKKNLEAEQKQKEAEVKNTKTEDIG